MWGFHDGMGWWMLMGGVWPMAFGALIIGAGVWAVRNFGRNQATRREGGETALEIAEKRLAQGEITLEQFDEIKQALAEPQVGV